MIVIQKRDEGMNVSILWCTFYELGKKGIVLTQVVNCGNLIKKYTRERVRTFKCNIVAFNSKTL